MTAPLSADRLEPIGAGIASSRTLWEPLLDVARFRPFRLFETASYDVWLEAHPVGRGRLAVTSTHVLAPVHGTLRIAVPETDEHWIVTTGQALATPLGAAPVIENATTTTAFAVHVYSPARPTRVPEAGGPPAVCPALAGTGHVA